MKQLTPARAVLAVGAMLVVAMLVFDLLTFGPASHALDPALPEVRFRF